jgi:hypothetical protein
MTRVPFRELPIEHEGNVGRRLVAVTSVERAPHSAWPLVSGLHASQRSCGVRPNSPCMSGNSAGSEVVVLAHPRATRCRPAEHISRRDRAQSAADSQARHPLLPISSSARGVPARSPGSASDTSMGTPACRLPSDAACPAQH